VNYVAPVVFLHGVAGSRRTYDWVPSAIAGHAVVRPDFRGHGEAPRTPGAYLIGDYAADAVEVLRSVGPAFVVGHSLGGVAAWCAAQTVPELVLGAMLEDPPLYRGTPEGHASNGAIPHFEHLRELSRDWQAAGVSEEEAAAQLAAERDAPEVSMPDSFTARAYALLHLDPSLLDTVIDGSLLAATDVRAPVEVPVTILAAGVDPAFTVENEARLAETHPTVEVARFAGAGHSIHDERAFRADYFAAVERFVTAQAAAARS
jgi:pimeloyl-ACP methyl ester carboxylesterase